MEQLFQHIKDSDRVWVYQANRFLSEQEIEFIEASGKEFTANWATHGTPLSSSVGVKFGLFVIVHVDEIQAKASGCSIDKSVHWISAVGKELQVDFLDRSNVAFLNNPEDLELVTLDEFEQRGKMGLLDADMLVFNNLVFTGKELKSSWRTSMGDSWHARYLKKTTINP